MTATISVHGRSISWTDGTWSGDPDLLAFVKAAAVGTMVKIPPVGPTIAVTLSSPHTVLAFFDLGPYAEVSFEGDWPAPPWPSDPRVFH